MSQTEHPEITRADIESTFLVLETIRDDQLDEPEHTILNAAHALVQEHEALIRADPPTDATATVTIPFRELLTATPAKPYDLAGYDVTDFSWVENGLRVEFVDSDADHTG